MASRGNDSDHTQRNMHTQQQQQQQANAAKLKRGSRSLSVIDQRHVKQALARRRMTRAEKRERNKTIVGTQAAIGEDADAQPSEELDSQLMKELEMRRDIMKLQKEHILQLQTEMKRTQDENRLLIQTLATRERQLSDLRLQMELLSGDTKKMLQESSRRQSMVHDAQQEELEDHEEEVAELTRQRDDALQKVDNLLGLIQDLATTQQVEGKHHIVESARAVKSALQLTGQEKFDALQDVRKGLLARWTQDELDKEVARQNAYLDEYLDRVNDDVSVSDSSTEAIFHLSSLRQRMRPRLRDLLLTSNDLRIRSTALSTSEPESASTSLNSSLNRSFSGKLSHTSPSRPLTTGALPTRSVRQRTNSTSTSTSSTAMPRAASVSTSVTTRCMAASSFTSAGGAAHRWRHHSSGSTNSAGVHLSSSFNGTHLHSGSPSTRVRAGTRVRAASGSARTTPRRPSTADAALQKPHRHFIY